MKLAFVFPGQGSQYIGMGQDLVEVYPEAREVFDEADRVLGMELSTICFVGPEETLNDTINTQPAVFTHSVAAMRVLQSLAKDATTSFVAGHSFGQYSALFAANAMDFADALKLIRERGRLMKEAGARSPGAMAAIIGAEDSIVEEICRDAGAQVAGYNAPGQIVITGTKESMERALELAKARGIKRAIPLPISIAAHSRLMEFAANGLAEAVSKISFRVSDVTVISNVTAQPLKNIDEIRNELVAQLTSPVQWVKTIQFMIAQGVTHIVELGPKDVLAGLIRRISKDVSVMSVGDVASVKEFINDQSH